MNVLIKLDSKNMDREKVEESRKNLYDFLVSKGFEKKQNSEDPLDFSCIKKGETFEIEFSFDEYDDNTATAKLYLPELNRGSKVRYSCEMYECVENDIFWKLIYKSLEDKIIDLIFKECRESLGV